MSRSEERGRGVTRCAFGLAVVDECRDVPAVTVCVVEVEPSDGVLDVEEVLKADRDPLRAADKEDVVRHLLRVDVPRGCPVPAEPSGPLLTGLIVEVSEPRRVDHAASI